MGRNGPQPKERPTAVTWLWEQLETLLSPDDYDTLLARYNHYRRAKELEAEMRMEEAHGQMERVAKLRRRIAEHEAAAH